MDLAEFKNKLDNREFWGGSSREAWEAARQWQDAANKEESLIKWSWDCGFKLDYDGEVCSISSRFYPPHRSHAKYGNYHGTISVIVGDATKPLHEHEIEAETLDELKELVEDYVSRILFKIHDAIKEAVKVSSDQDY